MVAAKEKPAIAFDSRKYKLYFEFIWSTPKNIVGRRTLCARNKKFCYYFYDYCASAEGQAGYWSAVLYMSLLCEMRSLSSESKHSFALRGQMQYLELQNLHISKVHSERLSNC